MPGSLAPGASWLTGSARTPPLDVQDSVQALRADAVAALRQLEDAEAGAAGAVSTLRELDTVKQRMEAACTTLKVRWLCSLIRIIVDKAGQRIFKVCWCCCLYFILWTRSSNAWRRPAPPSRCASVAARLAVEVLYAQAQHCNWGRAVSRPVPCAGCALLYVIFFNMQLKGLCFVWSYLPGQDTEAACTAPTQLFLPPAMSPVGKPLACLAPYPHTCLQHGAQHICLQHVAQHL